jgi:hypothetical protein
LQLHKGKYVRDHSRLEVQPTGRYFLNMMLGEWRSTYWWLKQYYGGV